MLLFCCTVPPPSHEQEMCPQSGRKSEVSGVFHAIWKFPTFPISLFCFEHPNRGCANGTRAQFLSTTFFCIWKNPLFRHAKYMKFLSVSIFKSNGSAPIVVANILRSRGIKYPRFLMRQQIKSQRPYSRAWLESTGNPALIGQVCGRGIHVDSDYSLQVWTTRRRPRCKLAGSKKYGRRGGWKGASR